MKKEYKMTEEHKMKISLANKGKCYSPTTTFKKGHEVSQGLREILRQKMTGIKRTEETRKKMSIAISNGKLGKPQPWNRGENNPSWKGGTISLRHSLMRSYKYKLWRADVFERDEFTCQDCGQKGGKLNADHIKPYSIIIEENNIRTVEKAIKCEELWDIDNGRTLCIDCHKKTDTYGGRAIKYMNI